MPKLPMGGKDTDYDSKKSRGRIINMLAEADKKQQYRTVKRCDGLTAFGTANGPVRSNFLVNNNLLYVITGTRLFRFTTLGVSEDLGDIAGSGEGQLLQNSLPGNNQICVLNGTGQGYIFDNTGLNQITDPDFFLTVFGAVLNERFWFIRLDSNEFFASEISDGFNYDPLSFATAEESPDLGVAIVSRKSSLWIGGTDTFEFWQTRDDVLLPVRKVRSSTEQRGVKAKASVVEIDNIFVFLADDLTVRLVDGTSTQIISDLEFNLKVRGNGTPTMPGFTEVEDAVGFFIDSPTHKIYYITFPTEGYTWGYDITTGLSHTRESGDLGFWRGKYSTIFNNKIIVGDFITSDIWILDPNAKVEGTEILRSTLRTPGISFPYDTTIPLIIIDMEVGQIEDPTKEAFMMVRYSKDGGYNWINHSDISLGTKGNYQKMVPIRNFGRLVRNRDFMLELIVTDAVRVQFYGADMPMGKSI